MSFADLLELDCVVTSKMSMELVHSLTFGADCCVNCICFSACCVL